MEALDPKHATGQDESDEDDYMKMTFDDPTTTIKSSTSKGETSLQRRLRLQREGEARARVKSKAELASEAEAARERALRTSLLEAANGKKSKGLAMMAKMGFKGGSLGKKAEDEEEEKRSEPIRIEIKDDRGGIGMENEKKRKMAEMAAQAEESAKKVKVDETDYRERVRREREVARLERQVHAAQKIAEKMDDEKALADGQEPVKAGISSRPLKSVNVLWRGLVRAREEAGRDRRMRKDLEASLSRLPTYEDVDEDDDDKRALGKEKKTLYEVAEDLDEEDTELDEFSALEPGEKLKRLIEHLRTAHHYCFWCKFTYPDDKMEGCPGLTEEDHD